MAGLTIATGTKDRFDKFKLKEKCSSAVGIEMLLLHFELFAALQRENKLLQAENERLKAEHGD